MPRLYDLTTAYQSVLQMLEDADESYIEGLTEALDSINAEISVKVDGISKMIKIFDDTAAIEAEIKRLQDKKKSQDNKVRWLKNYLHGQMEMLGTERIKTDLFTVSVQNNPPAVDDYEPELIPASYQKVTYDIDRRRILEDLKKGLEIPGCALKQSKGVRIR